MSEQNDAKNTSTSDISSKPSNLVRARASEVQKDLERRVTNSTVRLEVLLHLVRKAKGPNERSPFRSFDVSPLLKHLTLMASAKEHSQDQCDVRKNKKARNVVRARASEVQRDLEQRVKDPKLRLQVLHHLVRKAKRVITSKENRPPAAVADIATHQKAIALYYEMRTQKKLKKEQKHRAAKRALTKLKIRQSVLARLVGHSKSAVSRAFKDLKRGQIRENFSTDEINFIKHHLEDEQLIITLPDRKFKHCRFLQVTWDEAYISYKAVLAKYNNSLKGSNQRPFKRRSFTGWYQRARYRRKLERQEGRRSWKKEPKICTKRKIPFRDCLCPHCLGINMIRDTLEKYGIGVPKRVTLALATTLCPFQLPWDLFVVASEMTDVPENHPESVKIDPETAPEVVPSLTSQMLMTNAQRKCLLRSCDDCGRNKLSRIAEKMKEEITEKLKMKLDTTVITPQWKGGEMVCEITVTKPVKKERAKKKTLKKGDKDEEDETPAEIAALGLDENAGVDGEEEITEADMKAYRSSARILVKKVVENKTIETKTVRIAGPTEKTTFILTLEELVYTWTNDLYHMAPHFFIKEWQPFQFREKLNSLKKGEVLMVVDFLQNLEYKQQDEPGSAQFHRRHSPICPFVCYTRCLEPGCDKIVTEIRCYVYGHTMKTCPVVSLMTDMTVKSLKKKGYPVDRLYVFMDNCSGQFKSQFSNYFLGVSPIPTTWVYWVARHGKGAADLVGSILVTDMKDAVKTGMEILSEQDFAAVMNYMADKRKVRQEWQEALDKLYERSSVQDNTQKCKHGERKCKKVEIRHVEKSLDHFKKDLRKDCIYHKGIKANHMLTNLTGTKGLIRCSQTVCFCR